MLIDPRFNIIEKRFEQIKNIIAVSGGKGGIGKSIIASTSALLLTEKHYRVGLLDLDFSGPSTHVILGISGIYPEEDKGLIPPLVDNIQYMSLVYFTGDNPSPLRGIDISNIICELLAITIWDPLEFLIIDMPPGIGDTTLDVIRFIKKMKFLAVTIPSRVSVEVTKKELQILKELSVPVLGIIENMKKRNSISIEDSLKEIQIPLIGSIDFDEKIEEAIGNREGLIKTHFAEQLGEIIKKNITQSLSDIVK